MVSMAGPSFENPDGTQIGVSSQSTPGEFVGKSNILGEDATLMNAGVTLGANPISTEIEPWDYNMWLRSPSTSQWSG
jgi:hypothetical protein